jgi:hypothetical protein
VISGRRVIVPSIIIEDEALFYSKKEGGIPQGINLKLLAEQGRIERAEATVEEVLAMRATFDRVFIDGLHAGESEALALVMNRPGDFLFCSGDAASIRALAMLGFSHRGVSFSVVLEQLGLRKSLSVQYTEDFFRNQISQGQVNKIQGIGMAKRR